jgi:hypothetical protein
MKISTNGIQINIEDRGRVSPFSCFSTSGAALLGLGAM